MRPEPSALWTFLKAYWTESLSDIYPSIEHAVSDFMAIERPSSIAELCDEIVAIVDQALYAETANDVLTDPRLSEFWQPFTIVLSRQDCLTAISTLRGRLN